MTTVDLSKIPNTCAWSLETYEWGGYLCRLTDHSVTGQSLYIRELGSTPQEAVDNAIAAFLGETK